jgi:predicted Zn-dependent peptidase
LVERFFLDVSETSQTFEKIRGRLPFCGIRQWKISKFDQAQVALSIILPENISEVGFHIFQIALSYGFSSPLFDMIRNKMKIAYSINAAVEHFSENSIFTFYGNTSEKNIFDLMGGCKKALVQLMNNPENEIERVKKVLLLSAAHAQNSIIGNPEDNLFFFQRNGDFPPVPNEIENLANHIKPEIIKKHAEIILDLLPFAAVSVIGGIPQLSQEEFSKRCEAVLTNID